MSNFNHLSLDIIHGLYSLCWSQPVEWPRFIDQYEAWYRPQSMWDSLARAAGFIRVEEDETANASASGEGGNRGSHYTVRSHIKQDGTIGNIIKAYYATYVPIVLSGAGMNSVVGPPTVRAMTASTPHAAAPATSGLVSSIAMADERTGSELSSPTPFTISTQEAATTTSGSLYGGSTPAVASVAISTHVGTGMKVLDASSLYGGAGYVCSPAGANSSSEKKSSEEQPPNKRSRIEVAHESSSSSCSLPAITSFSDTEAPVELFESRKNRGHFYYTVLDSRGMPTEPKWVPVFNLISNLPVKIMEHPVNVAKIYVHAEHDKYKGRRVKKINYVVD